MIFLPERLYNRIKQIALDSREEEVCGIICGKIKDGDKYIKEIYHLSNIDSSKYHFTMKTEEQFEAVRDMRSKGLSLLGNFHSHIEGPPIPSEEDKRFAFDKTLSYMIISIENITNPVLKSFEIDGEYTSEEELVIEREKY